MTEDEMDEKVDRIHAAWGTPSHPRDALAGFYDSEDNLYRFIAVVKGGNNKTFYDGYEEWDEAAEYADTTLYDSAVDFDGQGVWLVVAIVDTTTDEVYYPTYRSAHVPEVANGTLAAYGV